MTDIEAGALSRLAEAVDNITAKVARGEPVTALDAGRAHVALRAVQTTPPPATGEAKWPEIRDSGGRTDFALTPATGEAGTRVEVEKARREFYEAARKRAATWLALRKPKSGDPGAYEAALKTYDEDVARSDAAYDAMLAAEARALPEAREGGGK